MIGPRASGNHLSQETSRIRKQVHASLHETQESESAGEDSQEEDHYRVERLLRLLVEVATDILVREFARLRVVPASHRDAFRKAVEEGLLSEEMEKG